MAGFWRLAGWPLGLWLGLWLAIPGSAAAQDNTAPAAVPSPTAAKAPAAPAPAAPAPLAAAQPTPPAERASGSPMIEFLFFSVTGWILIVCYVVFIALLVWLALELRTPVLMPLGLVDELETLINERKYKEAFEAVSQEGSLFGKVMTAGMARLQYGLEEARDAAAAMLENLRARQDHLLSYVAILGTLGPLIGLVGTVAGMIATFGELGRGGSPQADKLARGISHALNATLVGIFLSVLAIPAYSFLKNRLSRLILDLGLLGDDLLTQAYYQSKRSAGAGTSAGAAGEAKPGSAKPADPEPGRPS
ncbi:MAG TPA: MotA/TolQ/ExbB proton channel family protein [Gemmatales bacterium]|nr:MotA/TolQ/ExbB proton channel family protein [Gemmatales bacterium]